MHHHARQLTHHEQPECLGTGFSSIVHFNEVNENNLFTHQMLLRAIRPCLTSQTIRIKCKIGC
jgi:hypothetical protein